MAAWQAPLVRWRELFADLEAQAEALDRAALRAEVADRTRREVARLGLRERLAPAVGQQLAVQLDGAGDIRGALAEIGPDWLLLRETTGAELLVAAQAVLAVAGLSRRADSPEAVGEVGRRLDLRWALRGLARSRAGLVLLRRDGAELAGTLDAVGADHVELAEHPVGEARRPAAVRQVRLVPLAAISALRSG